MRLREEEIGKFCNDANSFLYKVANNIPIPREEYTHIQGIVYDDRNKDIQAIKDFFTVFSNICYGIFNNPELVNAFKIPDTLITYKEQKIIQAYRNNVTPHHTLINEFIIASVYGDATYAKKVIALCEQAHSNLDMTFIQNIINFFKNADNDMIFNAHASRPVYLSLEEEIKEYQNLSNPDFTSQRYSDFYSNLELSAKLYNWDFDQIDPKHEYRKTLTGNIGELLVHNNLKNTLYYIFTARDVGNFAGFDMSNFSTKENLIEIKSTFSDVSADSDIFFLGTTEYERLGKTLTSYKDTRKEQYFIYRVFIGDDFKIKRLLALRPISQDVFRDDLGNTYEINNSYSEKKVYERKKQIRLF